MDREVLGENLYQLIQLMTSTATNAQNFKLHGVGEFIQTCVIILFGRWYHACEMFYLPVLHQFQLIRYKNLKN